MAQKIGQIAYALARQLLVKDKGGIASLPNPKEILTKVQDIFDMLKAGGYNPISAEKSIKTTKDLKQVLTDVEMKLTIDKDLRSSQGEGIEEVMKKMDKGIPLNPSDQAKMEGIETVADDKVLDAFRGFKPVVIQGGKSEGIEKLLKSGDVKRGVAPKTKTKDYKKIVELEEENMLADEAKAKEFSDFSNRIKGMSSTDRVAERLKDLKGIDLSNLSGIEAQKIASEIIGRKGPFKTISNKGAKEVLGELDNIIKNEDLGTKLKNFDGDPESMATGGRIGFSEGSPRGFDPSNFRELALNQMIQDMIKKSPDGIVMDSTNPVEDLTTADRPTKPKIKAEPFDPYGPDANPNYFNQDTPEIDKFLEYDDGTFYNKGTGEYYKMDKEDEPYQVPGPSRGAKPVTKILEAASGGRIGFNGGGGAGFAGNPMEGDQYTMGQQIPGSPQVPMGEFGPLDVGIFGGGGYSKNEIVPGVDMATIDQNYGIAGQIPIGDTGFTMGGNYMKSRVNNRFTGEAIPGQTYKSVPTDSDTFNVGINFKKSLSGGRFGFKEGGPPNPGRRNFMKLMAGLASIPVLGKFFKGAKVAKKISMLKNTTTSMPTWFPDFVNKFIAKGVGKKIDQDLMEYTTKDLPGIKMTKSDDGRIYVEGQNDYGRTYDMEYTPPGYEVVDETTGKAVKTKGDFMAQEEVPVNMDPDGNTDFEGEILESVEDILTGDSRSMEGFAKGKKISFKEKSYAGESKSGQAEVAAENRADEFREQLGRDGEDFAKGGLAYMLGE